MTSLFHLPFELRQRIWRIYYTSIAVPHMRYACDFGGTETSGSADTNLLYVCKQIHDEALPVLYASLKLHVIYNPYAPGQLDKLPPRAVRDNVREILFHCRTAEYWGDDRPPKRPFPFHEFPRLATFRITKMTLVPVEDLHADDDLSTPLTPTTYAELSAEDKVKAWQRSGLVSAERVIRDAAEFGRSGWMSRVVDPQTYTEPARLEPDSDSEFDDEDWQAWTEIGSDHGAKEEAKRQKLGLFRSVIDRMRTIVELEYKPWHGDGPWLSNVIDFFLVVVDTRDEKIVEYRLPSPEELEAREEWASIAT